MIRFNFYLPEPLLSGYMLMAQERDRSVADCIRKYMKQGISGTILQFINNDEVIISGHIYRRV